jgi:hypothetical protein
MNGQKEQDLAACAHIHVERFTMENDGKVFEEQWRCKDCGAKFVNLDSLFAGPQTIKIMEPMKTLRDEFAMAALIGLVTHFNAFNEAVPEAAAKRAYEHADAMLEARK